ncbi:3879_t:CDS:1 [Funneliformis mosseae]|uniref:DNA topoisomerase (ATP-hydrolyzing) n=1 Tax=Funneliformis mosseae TaxID=27381 RepID=A0A9N9GF26_FUNMO|nr:3879_t:CDS:1 [Funneliformis mosseae]
MYLIKVDIYEEGGQISIFNNGKESLLNAQGRKFYMFFTSSNYDDKEKKVSGGRNGFGAKLANIYSTEFILEQFQQKISPNFQEPYEQPILTTCSKNAGD